MDCVVNVVGELDRYVTIVSSRDSLYANSQVYCRL